MDLSTDRDFLNSVLDQWLTGPGRAMKLTNDLVRNSYQFAEMLQGDKLELQGGPAVDFNCILDEDDNSTFVDPYDTRQVKKTQHTRKGKVDWSFFETSVTWSDEEKGLQEGEFKIFDRIETETDAQIAQAYNRLEATAFEATGNFASITGPAKKFPGYKYWVTRTGKAVDAGNTVAGIDTSLSPRYKSRYAGPKGNNLTKDRSDDTSRTLTSANQLLVFMRRAWRYANFRKPPGTKMAVDDSPIAKDIKAQKIYADEIAYDAMEELLSARNRADDMANKETDIDAPVWRGIPLDFVEDLGLDSNGVPAAAAGGGINSGDYPNTGELMMLKLRYFKPIVHANASPRKMPVEFLPLQQCWYLLFKWWLSMVCTSRMRQVLLWGFSPLVRA